MEDEDKKSEQSQHHIRSYSDVTRTAGFKQEHEKEFIEHNSLLKKLSEFERNIKEEVHDDLSKELEPESRKNLSKFAKEII